MMDGYFSEGAFRSRSVKLISAAVIFAVSHMCTGIGDTARVSACMVVVRILRSNATARHHICRNIRLVHTGEIRFTVGARMQVPRVSLAHRRESRTPPATCKYSQCFFLRYSNCERARPPAVPCAKCNDVRSDVRRILRV